MKWINRKDQEPDPKVKYILAWNETFGPYVLKYAEKGRFNDFARWEYDESQAVDFDWWIPISKPPIYDSHF